MKKILSLALICMMAVFFAACGNAENNQSIPTDSSAGVNSNTCSEQAPSTPPESEQQAGSSESQGTNTNASGQTPNSPPESEQQAGSSESQGTNTNGSNILVAYFSLAGEQYNVGVIEEGNTSIIAHMIAEQTGADLFEIEAVTPYPETHSELLEISRQEMSDHARPEIAGTVENMAGYDTVFLGYPNWWGDMPMIVYNFLESYDLSGKTIVPFCTHGGSGLSGTEGTIAAMYPDATMIDGFAIPGETAQNDRDEALQKVTDWLRSGGFLE